MGPRTNVRCDLEFLHRVIWKGVFGILTWGDQRVSLIRVRSDPASPIVVYSVLLEGSTEDPVTLVGDEALEAWLRKCLDTQH